MPLAMARKVALIVLVAWGVTPTAAQVLRGFSWSSSWSSSFHNGEMVERKEAKSSTFTNGRMVEHREAKSSTFSNGILVEHKESSLGCAHGRCSQSVTLSKPGSVARMTQQGSAAGFAPQFGLMRAAWLNGLIGRLPWPAMQPVPERQPTLMVMDVVQKRPASLLFLAPRSPGAQTGSQTQVSAARERMNNDAFKYLVCLVVAGGFLLTLISSAIMMWRIPESRELPLHPLSEPLAHRAAEGKTSNMTPRSVAVESKVCTESGEPAVKDYLEQMYARAAQRAHMAATYMYLSRMYAKACM